MRGTTLLYKRVNAGLIYSLRSASTAPAPKTWRNQDTLPQLPVPPLESTLKEYSRLIAPIISPKQIAKVNDVIEWFHGAEGMWLQKELHQLNSASPTSWLEGFWDSMYLEYRAPVVIHSNPFFAIHPHSIPVDQVTRAALLLNSTGKFIHLLREKQLEPDIDGDTPLCMNQYRKLFGTARIPLPGRDKLITSSKTKHIIVMVKNQIYSMDILDSLGFPIPVEDLKNQLSIIKDKAEKTEDEVASHGGIGVLTSYDRDTWAHVRSSLTRIHPKNEDHLELIDSAQLILSLDNVSISNNADKFCSVLLHNNGLNRWFDKLSLVVTEDGQAGINMEHAPVDGHTLLRYMSDIWNDSNGEVVLPVNGQSSAASSSKSAPPEPLSFKVEPSIIHSITDAKSVTGDLCQTTHITALLVSEFGKNAIKKIKISPDAFVQLSIQLAYFREHNSLTSTYESSMTKQFRHGRTETIRSATPEALAMARSFDLSKPTESFQLIQTAAKAHVDQAKRTKNGQGVDRHLFALKFLAKHAQQRIPNYTIPEIFTDPSYSQYMANVLSTSNCGSDAVDLFGFGPVNNLGWGLGYIIKNDEISMTVSSFQAGQHIKLKDAVRKSMNDILHVAKTKTA